MPIPPIGFHLPARNNAPSSSVFLDTLIRGKPGNHAFHVQTVGDRSSEQLLFPESRILLRNQLDERLYAAGFAALSAEEKTALRRWTAIDTDSDQDFGDNGSGTESLDGSGINYELNRKLFEYKPLDEEEQPFCANLSMALRRLPSLSGECLRVAEYRDGQSHPWGRIIRVGDVVTSFPCFMSAATRDEYARQTTDGLTVSCSEPGALAFLKISNTSSGVPLLQGMASLADEAEVLFPRNACFVVRGISVAEATSSGVFPGTRVGVLLEQVTSSLPPDVRNIHTGQDIPTYLLP